MATKPTTRIPDWASGGTRTDPGAGKEASGWAVSERPPAQWWNWILGAIGDWLSWSETSIDANEVLLDAAAAAVGALDAKISKAVGRVTTDGSSGITQTTNSYGFTASIGSGLVLITFDTDFDGIDYFVQLTNASNDSNIYWCLPANKSFASVYVLGEDPATDAWDFYIDVKGVQ